MNDKVFFFKNTAYWIASPCINVDSCHWLCYITRPYCHSLLMYCFGHCAICTAL